MVAAGVLHQEGMSVADRDWVDDLDTVNPKRTIQTYLTISSGFTILPLTTSGY
jgi:hypothetical protein